MIEVFKHSSLNERSCKDRRGTMGLSSGLPLHYAPTAHFYSISLSVMENDSMLGNRL